MDYTTVKKNDNVIVLFSVMAQRRNANPRPAPSLGLTQLLAGPFEMLWLRGPARLDGENVVLELSKAEVYHPMRHPDIGEELMRVKTKQDAVRFTARFGMLHEPGFLAQQVAPGGVLTEKVSFIFEKAFELNHAVRGIHAVRQAAAGNEEALRRLRSGGGKGESDRDALARASKRATSILSDGLGGASPCVYDSTQGRTDSSGQPGQIRIGIMPIYLWHLCYFQVALWLSEGVRIAVCEECNRVFEVQDGRQRFCQASCANRNRLVRWKAQRAKEAQKKGAKRNATTRKG